MTGYFEALLFRLSRKSEKASDPPPLLVELFDHMPEVERLDGGDFPFVYRVKKGETGCSYSVQLAIEEERVRELRWAVQAASESLDPSAVEPLTFQRLIEVLRQLAAGHLSADAYGPRLGRVLDLVAHEAVGLSRLYALALDPFVSEVFVDSDSSPLYLDHSKAGRCTTGIMLTERERKALETHLDTFRGYSPDYLTPSLKNDIEVGGARLRVSLDLDPVSVNRFSLDVRRLDLRSFPLRNLISSGTVSEEASALLLAWLGAGGNLAIVGETGTGKTTLLNALDEQLDPQLRRIYIEDAVETRDLLERGFHQLKLKVDPYDRGGRAGTSKEVEIVKVLHRSPDLVVLSEMQSAEHSRAFFHALAAGVRGMQTFHASSVEQAVRRWVQVHGIPEESLCDIGLVVQMRRPERIGPKRLVFRICELIQESGVPRVRELFCRNVENQLVRVVDWERVVPPYGVGSPELLRGIDLAAAKLRG